MPFLSSDHLLTALAEPESIDANQTESHTGPHTLWIQQLTCKERDTGSFTTALFNDITDTVSIP